MKMGGVYGWQVVSTSNSRHAWRVKDYAGKQEKNAVHILKGRGGVHSKQVKKNQPTLIMHEEDS